MGIVATRASFPKRGMFENERPRLLPMALRTSLIPPCHRETTRWLHDVHAMRVMALDATHLAFGNGMMLGQVEFGVNVEMALEAGLRVFSGIDDKLFAARAAD